LRRRIKAGSTCARWAIMTVTPFEMFVGLVMLAPLIVIVLAARRWDD